MSDWIPFPWGKKKKKVEELVDIESYLNKLSVSPEGFIEDEGVIYVRSMDLAKDSAVEDTIREVGRGNIVILNIKDLLHDPSALNNKVRRIKDHCASNDWEIGRISEIKLMVLPRDIRIAPSVGGAS